MPHPDAGKTTSDLPPPVLPQFADHPRYRILKKLGEGGMGTVYLAEHMRMERRVALKVMRPALLQDANAVQRFHQEVRAASQLSHPHIVTAFDADEAGSGAELVHFLAMEFVDGETLAAYIKRKGPLPIHEACRYIRQAAFGLQHAYGKGMVHRDIKPDNLMLAKNGIVKIMDFGLARLSRSRRNDAPPHITGEGVLMGTVDYMAPEQAGDSHSVDIRADIYSLGCSLHQLLAGQVPFPIGTFTERLLQHADAPPKDLHELRPEVPAELAAVVKKMMAKKPADRYPDPAAVGAALEPFASRKETLAPAAPVPRRRSWVLTAALVLIAAGSIAAVIAQALRVKPNNDAAKDVPVPTVASTQSADSEADKDSPMDEGAAAESVADEKDFSEIHGADRGALAGWMAGMKQRGLLPVSLTAQSGSTEPRFNAVAVKDTRKKTFRYELDNSRPARAPENMSHDTSQSKILASCTYMSGTELFRARVHVPDKGDWLHWQGLLDIIRPKLQERVLLRQKRPISISAFVVPATGNTRITVDFTNSKLAWDIFFDLSAEKLRAMEAEMRKRGSRPEMLATYGTAEPFRFILQVVENPGKTDWAMLVDVSLPIFENALKEKLKQGMRPICIVSTGPKDAPRYSCIWIRYKNP